MDSQKLNSWLSVGANLGVLIGLIVLIVEVQQNNTIAKAQMRSEIAQSAINNIAVNQTSEAIVINDKRSRSEELSPGELAWVRSFYRSEFRAWENVHYQYRIGLYDENEMDSYRFYWSTRANNCNELYAEFYFDSRAQYEPNFRAEMDAIFAAAGCENP